MTAQIKTQTPNQPVSLYVGDLADDVTEAILFHHFSQIGQVTTIRICRDRTSKDSLGYGYVNFTKPEDAQRALNILNYEKINGKPCRLMWPQKDPNLRNTNKGNLFVKNLAPAVDSKELYDTFSLLGNILSCKVATDEAGQSKGYGFVHFETEQMAEEAIKQLNDMEISSKKIYVGKFVARQERPHPSQWTNCYFKNIPLKWVHQQFIDFFQQCGEVTSLFLPEEADPEKKGLNRGYGFVNFKEHESCDKAIAELCDKTMEGAAAPLYICKALKKSERQRELRQQSQKSKEEFLKKIEGKNVYVKNIDPEYTEEKMRKDFEFCGTVTSARIMKDEHGNSKCFGFICFDTTESAQKAVAEMNNKQLGNGKTLYVNVAQRKDERRIALQQQHSQQRMMLQPPFYPGPYPPMYPQMMPRGAPYGATPYGAPPYGAYPPQRQIPPRGKQMAYPPMYAQGPNRPMPQNVPQQQRQPMMMPQQRPMMQSTTTAQQLIANAHGVEEQKNALGEYLYSRIARNFPDKAPKITGMLLEMDVPEILLMIDTPQMLDSKIKEAINVLNETKN